MDLFTSQPSNYTQLVTRLLTFDLTPTRKYVAEIVHIVSLDLFQRETEELSNTRRAI